MVERDLCVILWLAVCMYVCIQLGVCVCVSVLLSGFFAFESLKIQRGDS